MSEILNSMELVSPKQKIWSIELEAESEKSETAVFRTCFQHGKVTERIFHGTPFDRKRQYIQMIMKQLRKGYVYQNPDADEWEPLFHGYVDKTYTGFMPIVTNKNRSDFYVIRVKGDFEDEILYHYDENGNLLDQSSLGAKRLTYRGRIRDDRLIVLQERNFEIYDPDTKKLEMIEGDGATHRLDKKGDHSDAWNGIQVDYLGYDDPSVRGYFDITDMESSRRIIRILNEFTVRNAFCAFTSNRLVVHTDYGVLSIYKIRDEKRMV